MSSSSVPTVPSATALPGSTQATYQIGDAGTVTLDTAGDVLTIKGRGITPLRGSQRGDLRVGVHVVTPTRLDHKERALIEEFAKRTKAPAPKLAEFHQGLFAKLRGRLRNG